MTKLALITDQHFGARGDSVQLLDYYEQFYKNVFFPYIDKEQIKTIIDLGDTFDRRKYVNFQTLNRTRRMWINPIKERGIELHSIVGNHSVFFKNTNEINSMTELFDGIQIYSSPADVDFDGLSIMMLPWLNSQNYSESMDAVAKTRSQVLFGHLDLNGFDMHIGHTNTEGMEIFPFEKFDIVCSGHFHHKSSRGNIHYLGNPYELTWNDYNDRRGFHIFDTEKRDLTFIQNPYRLFRKLWYDDEGKTLEDVLGKFDFDDCKDKFIKLIVQTKSNPYWFDLVMDSLYKANAYSISIVDDNKNLNLISDDEIVNEADDTLTSLNKHVDSMNMKTNKDSLKRLFMDLYTEAQNNATF